ncbi:SDR family NAD(P)-dependent oxidoreductase [Nocardia sp. NPDC057455]|uniref:SDR family NAD(P)-dependent oxidoreductase n=1 Tax=Nocardia sp. NPDC057455 TaxID=3346138 RepID=UPI00367073D1
MNTVSFDYTGTRVLVTGGTSGIGHAVAAAFAGSGAEVTVTGTRASAGDYDDVGLGAFTYKQCQLSDTDSIDALLDSLGDLDILINNAGGPYPGGLNEWDPAGYTASITQNLLGPMRLTVGCHDRLKASTVAGGSSVVSVVSMSAFRSAMFVPGYGSSKHGLIALTMNLARLWAGDGIRVNAVAPGLINTRMTAAAMDIPQVMDVEIGFHTPLGRPGTPEDLHGAVLFLCSRSASYITGTSVAVDGGYLTV